MNTIGRYKSSDSVDPGRLDPGPMLLVIILHYYPLHNETKYNSPTPNNSKNKSIPYFYLSVWRISYPFHQPPEVIFPASFRNCPIIISICSGQLIHGGAWQQLLCQGRSSFLLSTLWQTDSVVCVDRKRKLLFPHGYQTLPPGPQSLQSLDFFVRRTFLLLP